MERGGRVINPAYDIHDGLGHYYVPYLNAVGWQGQSRNAMRINYDIWVPRQPLLIVHCYLTVYLSGMYFNRQSQCKY